MTDNKETPNYESYICVETGDMHFFEANWFLAQIHHRGYTPFEPDEEEAGFVPYLKRNIKSQYQMEVSCTLSEGEEFSQTQEQNEQDSPALIVQNLNSDDSHLELSVIHLSPAMIQQMKGRHEQHDFEAIFANLTQPVFMRGQDSPFTSGSEKQRVGTSTMLIGAVIFSMSLNKVGSSWSSALGTLMLFSYIGYQKGITPGRVIFSISGARYTHIRKAVVKAFIAHIKSFEQFAGLEHYLYHGEGSSKVSADESMASELTKETLSEHIKFTLYDLELEQAQCFLASLMQEAREFLKIPLQGKVSNLGTTAPIPVGNGEREMQALTKRFDEKYATLTGASYTSYLFFYEKMKELLNQFVGKNTGFVLQTLLTQTVINGAVDFYFQEPFENRIGLFSHNPRRAFYHPLTVLNDIEDFTLRNWYNIFVFGWYYKAGRFTRASHQ
ncbi:hypothetical protein [Endozoicomonas arenosclerae]|uniref:hypothetical protein n=1 Tax=Endozoicomonas arenosclerae TaxID=1633495 RepID=UPI0012946E58|nr:hypothetical protein [Endozoicomonas arenosclerae]